jgi:hypothetical protein
MTHSGGGRGVTRRGWLAVCAAAGVGGCTNVDSLLGPDAHPFADRTVPVQIQTVQQEFDRLERLLKAALSFWNETQETLPYSTTLTYDPETDTPDVLVSEVPTIAECGVHTGDDITGCAPILQSGDQSELPASLEVNPQPPGEDWHYRRVIEHELGHLLGLTHDDEPARVMHASWQQRYPQYERRRHVFELRQERGESYNQGVQYVSEGFDAAEADEFGAAGEQFQQARGAYRDAQETIATARAVADELEPFEPADLDRLDALLTTETEFVQTVLDGLEAMVEGAELLSANEDDGVSVYNDGVGVYDDATDIEIPGSEAYLSAVGFPTAIITETD